VSPSTPASIISLYSNSVKGYISIDIESKYFLRIVIASIMYDGGVSFLDSPVSIRMCLSPFDEMRHMVRKSFQSSNLLYHRNSNNDLGFNISQSTSVDTKENLSSLIKANFKRVQEGLRSIEECLKVLEKTNESKIYESLRFISYSLEKAFLTKKSLPTTDIYGILGEEFSNGKDNISVVKEMIDADIKIIQYREKNKTKSEKLTDCKVIRDITSANNVVFIVNDDIDIALTVGADGIHIGQDDIPIEDARKISKNMIIGLSTHNSSQALEAVKKGADYIGVGPIFDTTTKSNVEKSDGLTYLQWVSKNINIPYVAIGGIKESNICEVKRHGGKYFAMISEIVDSKNIREQVKILRNKIYTERVL